MQQQERQLYTGEEEQEPLKLTEMSAGEQAFFFDPRMAAFGQDYFSGVMLGSAVSAVVVAFAGRRSYKRGMAAMAAHNKKVTEGGKGQLFNSLRNFDNAAYFMSCASAMFVTVKTAKFFGAYGNWCDYAHEEYYHQAEMIGQPGFATYDEKAEFEALQDMRRRVRILDVKKLTEQAHAAKIQSLGHHAGTFTSDYEEVDEGGTSTLFAHSRNRGAELYKRMVPNFYDGITVGVVGSILDASNPQRTSSYYCGWEYIQNKMQPFKKHKKEKKKKSDIYSRVYCSPALMLQRSSPPRV